ncbi:hypothetical protein KSP39_PZI000567 [Platanthera zijinensis]|uniref:RanBP2-type domain-containing protein n=1 Tax=Platanthera zijinensis TaxID=2320716 RepID=A0AAP0C3F7_9ASPA
MLGKVLVSFFSSTNSSRNPLCTRSRLPMSSSFSSWSCSHCTFLNPPSQKLSCQMCLSASVTAGSGEASSLSVGVAASPGRWPCSACTYLNRHGSAFCEVCGTRSAPFSRLLADDLDPDELAATGSVFLPLQRCGSKRPIPVESSRNVGPVEKLSRSEKHEHMDLSSDSDQSSDLYILKILSYNVWFREDLEVHRRMEALGNLIQQHLPDFICFQEVTPNIYEIFERSKWWKAYRCSISQDLVGERPYFCMQMSKLPVEAFNCKPFANSIMGRELCSAEIKLTSGKRLVIATSHLESPCPAPPKWDQMYSAERVSQAKDSLNNLKNSRNVIFAGDMNWDEKSDGAFPLLRRGVGRCMDCPKEWRKWLDI